MKEASVLFPGYSSSFLRELCYSGRERLKAERGVLEWSVGRRCFLESSSPPTHSNYTHGSVIDEDVLRLRSTTHAEQISQINSYKLYILYPRETVTKL